MIDTHCHILPQIDDGAANLQVCFNMCMLAARDGIGTICATPHYNGFWSLVGPERVRRLVDELNAALGVHRGFPGIVPGMEIRVSAELENLVDSSTVIALGNFRTLLIEFHPSGIPTGFVNMAKRLVAKGYSILVAHPEKNLQIQDRPELLFSLLQTFEPWKIMTQLTAASITGEHGRREKRTARLLLENNLAHVIATDAHDDRVRPPVLSKGLEAAESIVGTQKARQMVTDVPNAILGNGGFPEWSEPTNPRKWWRIF